MNLTDSHSTPAMTLTVKKRLQGTDTFTCLTEEGHEVLVDLHSGATTKPLDLDNITGKRVWVEWLQPYEWIAESPRVLPDKEEANEQQTELL